MEDLKHASEKISDEVRAGRWGEGQVTERESIFKLSVFGWLMFFTFPWSASKLHSVRGFEILALALVTLSREIKNESYLVNNCFFQTQEETESSFCLTNIKSECVS